MAKATYRHYRAIRRELPLEAQMTWDKNLMFRALLSLIICTVVGFVVAKQVQYPGAVAPIVIGFMVLGAVLGLLWGMRFNLYKAKPLEPSGRASSR